MTDVRMPDGTVVTNVPDGITQSELMRRVGASQPSMYEQTAGADSNTDNLLASIGGAMYAPYLGAKQLLGKSTPDEIKQFQDSMAGLWSTPMGKAGTVAGGLAAAAPLAMIPGANTAAGAALVGSGLGAIQPVGAGESRGLNTAIGGAGGVGGKYLGDLIGRGLASRSANTVAELAAQKSQNAVRDATLGTAREAGYVLPPSQVSPSILNRMAEGFAGKLTTAQNASAKNQAVTDNLARQALKLPPDAPLTVDTMKAVRSEAGKAYEAIKGFGDLPADEEYAHSLYKIATAYDQGHGGMKALRNPEVEALLKDASAPAINSANAVEFLKNLRDNGFANVAAQEPKAKALGRTQLGIANAVEDLMDRTLEKSGQQDLLTAYREARQQIAKSYTVEKAINPGTAHVQANKLAAALRRGRPLSGELETIGRVGSAFPKAMTEQTTSLPQISPLDYMAGGIGSMAAGPGALLGVLARPAVRAAILSPAWQKALAKPKDYEQGLLGKLMPEMANSEIAGLLGRLGGAYGGLELAK